MFQNVKVGDVMTRVMFGFREELWKNEARVTAVDEDKITCTVYVDVPRTMWFSALSGVSVYGKEYGWLDKVSA